MSKHGLYSTLIVAIIGSAFGFTALPVGAAPTVESGPNLFHVEPVKPVQELLPAALAAHPPVEPGQFIASDLVEVITLDPTIKLDIRYASTRNFLSTIIYSQARAFLQRPAVLALLKVQRTLRDKGLGLLIYDAYRPWYVTKLFWEATPPKDHKFVADPSEGSRHNRGCAVDLTLYELKSGRPVNMPSGYDEMTSRAYPNYSGGSRKARENRDLLRQYMEAEGFTVYPYEWWHFDYRDWNRYAIENIRFEDIGVAE